MIDRISPRLSHWGHCKVHQISMKEQQSVHCKEDSGTYADDTDMQVFHKLAYEKLRTGV